MLGVLKTISAVFGALFVVCVIGLILTIGGDGDSVGESIRVGLAWIIGAIASAGTGAWTWSQVVELTPVERSPGHTYEDGDDGYDRVEPPNPAPRSAPRPEYGPRTTYSFDPDD